MQKKDNDFQGPYKAFRRGLSIVLNDQSFLGIIVHEIEGSEFGYPYYPYANIFYTPAIIIDYMKLDGRTQQLFYEKSPLKS